MDDSSYHMNNYILQRHVGSENKGFETDVEAGKQQEETTFSGNSNGNGSQPHFHDDDSDEDDNEKSDCCSRSVGKVQEKMSAFFTRNAFVFKAIFYVLLVVGFFVYYTFAMLYEIGSESSWRLFACTLLGVLILVRHLWVKIKRRRSDGEEEHSETKNSRLKKMSDFVVRTRLTRFIQWFLAIGLTVGFIVYLALVIAPDEPRNLISLSGMGFFILSFYLFSHNPAKVKWRPVFWGLAIQIVFAFLILRTSFGYDAFKWLGDRVIEFLNYTDEGSKFLFGPDLIRIFAFSVLPVVVFFSAVVSMLYYMGVMQVIIKVIGKFLAFCLGTSATESVNAAANIFIGQTEAPLLIRPFLNDMTNSEIHAVMTGGFATMAGAVMAAYIKYDVPANHLLSASVMSAPAALALSKLFYPETKKTKIRAKDVYRMSKGEERNLIEAAANGASLSISLVANIAVNLIAFVALLAFVNSTLMWFGDRVGYHELTFQNICSYVFWPISFLMGVDQDDCRTVAELIGTKTFLNEFVAYVALSGYIHNRETLNEYIANASANATHNLTGYWYHKDGGIYLNDTGTFLEKGLISERTVVLATYALCGFSNLSSMGMQLGGLGAMAPARRGDLARLVFRAMIAGNVACFMTACIAGLLYEHQ